MDSSLLHTLLIVAITAICCAGVLWLLFRHLIDKYLGQLTVAPNKSDDILSSDLHVRYGHAWSDIDLSLCELTDLDENTMQVSSD